MQNFRTRQYANAYQNNDFAYTQYPPAQPAQTAYNHAEFNYGDLQERAQNEGIRLHTAGGMKSVTEQQPNAISSPTPNGCFNMGLTLFKSAFIIFCIVAFESLIVFFTRAYLGVSAVYPALGFAVGFIQFIVCAILYAMGYRPRARRKKHPSYIVTASILFVISVIIVSMIAVYFKAQLGIPSQLLSYIVIPVIYLMNILFFVIFFYLFSTRTKNDK